MTLPTATVVNLRTDEFDVDITRPGPWGNPFRIGPDGTRDEVIAKFRDWMAEADDDRAIWMWNHLEDLIGERLGCYCAPQPCHGDILKIYADAYGAMVAALGG